MKSSSIAYNRRETCMLPPMSMEPWPATKKALHQCEGDTSSCPGPYPTAACPEFHISCSLGREFSPCLYAAAVAHGAMGCY